MRRVVVDTNVLISGLRSRRGAAFRLLSLIGTGRFELCLSVPLLLEYEDVLARQVDRLGLTKEQVGDVLDYLCSVAIKQDVFYLWRPFLKDPKDDMVLELAVAAGCDSIVTFNLRDFAGSERFGVRICRPQTLLREIGVAP